MKKVLFKSFLILAFLANSAKAEDSSTKNLVMNANVSKTCILDGISEWGNNTGFVGPTTPSGQILDLKLFANGEALWTPGISVPQRTTEAKVSGFCNYAHIVAAKSVNGGLIPPAENLPLSGNFVTKIEYNATLLWGNKTVAFQVDQAGEYRNSTLINGAVKEDNGKLTIRVFPPSDPAKTLIAGEWSDTLIIKIGAGF